MTKLVIGIGMILAGVALGLYVGLYLMLYGGIMQLVHGLSSQPVIAKDVALGVVRVLGTSVSGWAAVALLAIPGGALVARAR